jgi:hypothetical protein
MQRAEYLSRAGQARHRHLPPEQLGETEVGDFYTPLLVEEHVFRLDVAVNDAFFVRILQRVTDLWHDLERLLRREFAGLQRLPQIDAVHVLHQEKEVSSRLAEVVDRDDVRVAQLREGAGFTEEPLGERRILAHFRRQHFERDRAIESDLPRLVNGPHAALADELHNFELREVRGEFFERRRSEIGAVRGRAPRRGAHTGPQKASRTKPLRRVGGKFGPALGTGLGGHYGDSTSLVLCSRGLKPAATKKMKRGLGKVTGEQRNQVTASAVNR